MSSASGPQCILQYKVLSGIIFLEEMPVSLLNKRLRIGITLPKYHPQGLGYFDMKYLGTAG